MLAPRCERCGSCLRPVPEDSIDRVVAQEKETPSPPPSKSADVTGPFAVMVVIPLLVPFLGIHLGPFVFGVPMVALIFAAVRAAVAVGKSETSVDRRVWRLLVLAAALAAVTSAVAMVTMQLGLGLAAYYVGSAASVAALVAAAVLASGAIFMQERREGGSGLTRKGTRCRLHQKPAMTFFIILFSSASKTIRFVFVTASGLTERESMPSPTRYSASSG